MSKKGGGGTVDPYAGWEGNRNAAQANSLNYALQQMQQQGLINDAGMANNFLNKPTSQVQTGVDKKTGKPIYSTVQNDYSGLQGQEYINDFNTWLGAQASGLSRGSDLSGTFGTNAWDNWYSNKNNALRSEATNQLDSQFKNAGDNYWKNTADDDILSGILSNQYNNALSQIEAQKNRGFLDDAGYNNALASLQKQNTAGNSQLQSLGQSVLGGYKDKIQGRVGEFYNDANKLKLGGQGLDYDAYNNALQQMYDEQLGGLEGDLFNATNGLNLFNTSNTINDAAISQGQGNNMTTDLYSAIEANKNKKNANRGLGDSSSF